MLKRQKTLIAAIALALCASGAYVASQAATSTITSKSGTVSATTDGGARSSISSNTSSSVGSNTSSTVTSSNNFGSTSTIVSGDNSTSTCATDFNGSRCEVTCVSPRLAQCIKASDAAQPSCFCQ